MLERWHKQIKHEEAGFTKIKRLDKALNIVIKTCAKRLLGRLISIERRNLIKRVQLIHQRHSIKMDENISSIIQLEENKYVITKIVGKNEIQSYDPIIWMT